MDILLFGNSLLVLVGIALGLSHTGDDVRRIQITVLVTDCEVTGGIRVFRLHENEEENFIRPGGCDGLSNLQGGLSVALALVR